MLKPGLFLKKWKMLIFGLTQNEGPLAEEIRDSMVRRESILFDNDILLAAIYVDPMYRISLIESQQSKSYTF